MKKFFIGFIFAMICGFSAVNAAEAYAVIDCDVCKGSGKETKYIEIECSVCNGGRRKCTACNGTGSHSSWGSYQHCNICIGSGKFICGGECGFGKKSRIATVPCKRCGRTGKIRIKVIY